MKAPVLLSLYLALLGMLQVLVWAQDAGWWRCAWCVAVRG
jgi:hypothetical protein